MELGMLLDEVKRSVKSRSKKSVQAALAALDDCQLLENNIDPQIFDIYVWLLSDPNAISVPGIDKVFVNFTGDIQKYSGGKISKIISTIDENRVYYKSQILRMAAADFVARNGEVTESFDVLKRWAVADDHISREMARVGLGILLAGSRVRDIKMREKAATLKDSLMQK
ncbi:hypothetical protein [Burkholderia multivorans]|uniref:hypothetical protein n=2 Tax=Burkholderia multivorans TaxID=87883 RepID=UPI0011B36F50|nr:hypothetical protein [Burkholderia multivorans]MBR7898001.1 hypothetical protein [Burkholderia multivorans]